MVRCRWQDGCVCPKWSGKSAWLNSTRYVFACRSCGRQTSPIAGTIMHRSHVPVQEWFWAAYLVATHTPGISALQLQRQLGIGNYRAAWHLLHRLRRGMLNEERTCLSGLIEAGETYSGGPAKGKTGRGVAAAKHKPLVAGAGLRPVSCQATERPQATSGTGLFRLVGLQRRAGAPLLSTHRQWIDPACAYA